MFVNVSFARVLMTLLFYIDITSPDKIEIARFIPRNWAEDGVDLFKIHRSTCEQIGGRQFVDDCITLCPADYIVDVSQYGCACEGSSATLTYLNNTWRCLENTNARNQLGCKDSTLFTNERAADRLQILNTDGRRRTKLTSQSCRINLNYSWYINCYGEKISLKQFPTSFDLEWLEWRFTGRRSAYYVKVLNDSSLRGRIVNLGIKCPAAAGTYKYRCLLFKVEGNYSCPLQKPPKHGFQSSSIGPTYTVTPSVSLTTTYLSSTASVVLSTTDTRPIPGSTKAVHTHTPTKQNPRKTKEKLKSDDASSPSSLGLIAGVTASTAAVLLIIVVVVICHRRRKSRKGAQASANGSCKKNGSEGNTHQNIAFQPEVQNAYETSRHKKPGPSCVEDDYAALKVPEGHNIYGPGNVDEPFYNVLQEPALEKEEDSQRYGSLSLDPAMYHTLEELPDEEQKNSEYSYLTEPTYNILEGPVLEGTGETGSHGVTSVNEPFYNTLEEPAVSNEDHPSNNHDPVYNTLEDPLSYGPEPITLQDHVYNVLEGPSANGNVKKDTKIPVYAVVNKRKK